MRDLLSAPLKPSDDWCADTTTLLLRATLSALVCRRASRRTRSLPPPPRTAGAAGVQNAPTGFNADRQYAFWLAAGTCANV
jgi:hypothetical protein